MASARRTTRPRSGGLSSRGSNVLTRRARRVVMCVMPFRPRRLHMRHQSPVASFGERRYGDNDLGCYGDQEDDAKQPTALSTHGGVTGRHSLKVTAEAVQTLASTCQPRRDVAPQSRQHPRIRRRWVGSLRRFDHLRNVREPLVIHDVPKRDLAERSFADQLVAVAA